MSLLGSRQTLQMFSPFLGLQPHIRESIHLHILPFQYTISSFASYTRYTSGFPNPTFLKRLRFTCLLIDEEVLAVYCSNNSFTIQVRYDKIYYPQKADVQALESMTCLRHVRSLVVEIMVRHRSALLADTGYRYDTRKTKEYLGIIPDILERAKGGGRGMLLGNLTLNDREGRIPLLMRQHAKETGLEIDEDAMYELLVELARGKNIGILVIDSDNGELKHIVDMR